MHESSYDDCGCCADAHFGALLNQTSRLIRRALDARINAEVSSELSGVRGMVLGDIVRAERQGRDVYQRDIEQWFNIRRSSVTAMLQGMAVTLSSGSTFAAPASPPCCRAWSRMASSPAAPWRKTPA